MQYISKTYSIYNNFNSIGEYGFMFNDCGFPNKYDSYESVSYCVSKGGFIHYYPFGMVMPGRTFSSNQYRYGFNGKEKDEPGMGGGGSTYDYGFRIYNPQIARFLSVDPLSKSYPWYTPYQFAGNKPIVAIDLDGLEEKVTIGINNYEIRATYVASQEVCDNVDIVLMQKIVNQTLNSNPTVLVIEGVDIDMNLPSSMSDDNGGQPPLHVQFAITILEDNPENRRKTYSTTGQRSMGGTISMGKANDKGFTPLKDGSLIPAYHLDGDIFLNPQFFDKSSPNYTGFGEQSTGSIKLDGTSTSSSFSYSAGAGTKSYSGSEGGVFSHEIGHDLGLDHEKGIYPKTGTMSTEGLSPTMKEVLIIMNPENSRVIQPNEFR